ncbi:hypothetical protein RhiirA4_448005 [Rhizophagus irregularis]|uniref:Uncharacterized protein n=1 Tax=Rhizophagus irregularis TaxID=588596 RepID=A0A2I1GUN3_9GLOM|nr:hypothetical protein RhiirA4_446303 [Rhizophagus irregularis]PKY54384.1 hypothetical protein RhiirA4_448005 [Rhizophagus irregularis]
MRRKIKSSNALQALEEHRINRMLIENIHDADVNEATASAGSTGFSIDLTKLGKQNYERKISYKNETDQIMAIYSPRFMKRKELKELNPTYTTRQLQEILRETSEINDFEFTEFYSIVEPTQLVITKRIEPIIKEDKGPSTTECLSNLSRDEIINLISD